MLAALLVLRICCTHRVLGLVYMSLSVSGYAVIIIQDIRASTAVVHLVSMSLYSSLIRTKHSKVFTNISGFLFHCNFEYPAALRDILMFLFFLFLFSFVPFAFGNLNSYLFYSNSVPQNTQSDGNKN